MLKENERLYNNVLSLADVLISLSVLLLLSYLRVFKLTDEPVFMRQYLILALIILPVWFITGKFINGRFSQSGKSFSEISISVLWQVAVGTVLLFLFIFFFKLDKISRLVIFTFALCDYILLLSFKLLIFKINRRQQIKGKGLKHIIIIADKNSDAEIKGILSEQNTAYQIQAIVTDSMEISRKFKNIQTMPENFNLHKFVENKVVDTLIYCKSGTDNKQIKELLYACSELGIELQLRSDFFSMLASRSHINYRSGVPVISFSNTPSDYFALFVKRSFDYIFSFFALLLFLPGFVIIGILIKLDSPGPVFFKQKRVGLRGRTFTIIKFRTMTANADDLKKDLKHADETDGPVFKIKNDPRITKVGKFLRQTSLDEFPQFFNVLKGDMSIVGPRPPVPEEVKEYLPGLRRRLSVLPGITCIWQVSERNQSSFEEWMKMDLRYIDNWSLRLDFSLLLKTIKVVFKRTGY